MKKIMSLIIFLLITTAIFCGCTDSNDKDNDDIDNGVEQHDFDKNWETVTVDEDGWVGIDPMIAVDLNDNPHIAYYDQGNRDLKYAYFDGIKWNVETVDSEGDVGEEPGIDIDSNNNPHICYKDHTNSALKYATKKNGVWTTTILDSVNIEIEAISTSLKVDSKNNIHIAFSYGFSDHDSFNEDVFRYAFYNGLEWNIEHVRRTGCDMIIDIDGFDIPHISFKGDNIMYATKPESSWIFEIVDNIEDPEGDTGIAVQSDGTPHIIYHDYKNGLIKYATKTNSVWSTSTIADNQDNQEGVKIDVDNNDFVHVVFSDIQKNSMDGYLTYAKKEGNSWIKEQVYMMDNPAIAVDSNGDVHIAHNKCSDGNPLDYDPDYTGDQKEIEILKYSKRK
jgi:hypothetical protein